MKLNRSSFIEKIADLPFYTEGPVADGIGNFFCTTLHGGSILKINNRNEISEWAKSVCPNGQIILPGGDHLVCDSMLASVRRFSRYGKFLKNEIEGYCADFPIYSPNDLIKDQMGNLYFTDSIRHKGKVCFFGINGEQKIVVDGLDYPNGLVLSADEDCLYVAESYENRILKLVLKAPGLTGESPKVFVRLPVNPSGNEIDNLPDGLALNNRGELLVAHYGMQAIQLISDAGKHLATMDTGMPLTSNLCFLDDNTLVVTGGFGEPGPGCLFKISF
ncbi:MAG TPA: SMP-30/gluconolactonase/LRE family protein [Daejeonella sp.]|uniref:SMP-30/gluconolactonase/LRE family protein n=1 Tax=Daejeonella sp. TaxID=2805397 RepID=UPI002ED8BA59